MAKYHVPVLLAECLEALNLQDGKIYVDATFGGGGHSLQILERRKKLKLFAFDQDPDSVAQSKVLKEKYPEKFVMIQENFVNIRTGLALERVKKVDGILFDLGVSSHQINDAARGFSFRGDGKLNMRMDQDSNLTAADVVNTYSFEKLTKIFREYGEEKEAARIAGSIILEREKEEIKTTLQLSAIIENCIISKKSIKAKARIFQALRIYINKEMDVLQTALEDSVKILNPDHYLATTNEDADLRINMIAKRGKGYIPGELNKDPDLPIDFIPIDSIFSPVERVNFNIENTRVGNMTNFEKLTLEIWTDGSITPEEAMVDAVKILINYLSKFLPLVVTETPVLIGEEKTKINSERDKILEKTIEELDLSVRAYNCLKKVEVNTVEELIKLKPSDLLKVRNLGKKTLKEINEKLESISLTLQNAESGGEKDEA